MFLDCSPTLRATLAKARVIDDMGVAAVSVEVVLALDGNRWVEVVGDRTPSATPDVAKRPLWRGVSVTASGAVYGPARPPFVRRVSLEVAEVRRELVIHGDRVWARQGRELVPSEPRAFERIEMSFEHAFGGSYDVPPGIVGGLPHPGGRICHPLNPTGKGFYPDMRGAEGNALPNIERLDARVRRWSDQPVPFAFAPCPLLPGLRVIHEDGRSDMEGALRAALHAALRGFHHAPGELVFARVLPGEVIRLRGMADRDLELAVPPPPATVRLRTPGSATEVAARVRSIALDSDRRTARIIYGHTFSYAARNTPEWIVARRREAA